MPRRPKPPSDDVSSNNKRYVKIHEVYYALLWEICQKLRFNPNVESSIPRCLEYIIKDLYDTLLSEEEAEAKEVKKKEVKPEEVMEYVRVRVPPPPP
jgi:hypothetical protein